MSRIIEIALDIETLPTQDVNEIEAIKEETAPPKTIKKQETIDAWYKDKFEPEFMKKYLKTALDSMRGEIFCINAQVAGGERFHSAINDGHVEKTEKEVLIDLYNFLSGNYSKGDTIIWIGHNIRRFDLQWIWRKAMKYELFDLAKLIPRDRFNPNVQDTMELWAGPEWNELVSINEIANFLGLPGKTEGMHGGLVYEFYLNEEYQKIIDYCHDDVNMEMEIYKYIKNGL